MLALRVSYNICRECAFVYITPAPFCSNNLTLIILPLNCHSSINFWNHIKWFRYLCCEVAFCSTLWLDEFHRNVHRYLSGTAKTNYKIWVTSTLFTRSPGTYIKKACLYSILLTNDQILTKLTQIIFWEDLNEWLEFGSIDLNSKITNVT